MQSTIENHKLGISVDPFRNFSSSTFTTSYSLLAAACNGTTYVVAGDRVYRSTDASTWALSTSHPSYQMTGLTAHGTSTTFAAVGIDQSVHLSTDSGDTWTRYTTADEFRHIASNGSRFVAVGSNFSGPGSTNVSITSTTGTSWTTSTMPYASTTEWDLGIASNGTNFVAIGYDYPSGLFHIATTTDGTTWTGVYSSTNGFSTITSSSGRYVISGTNTLYSSDSGSTWTTITGQNNGAFTACSDNSRFLLGQNLNDIILTSDTGIAFQQHLVSSGLSAPSYYGSCSKGPSYYSNTGPYVMVAYEFANSRIIRIAPV
jgi:hypothetical protein